MEFPAYILPLFFLIFLASRTISVFLHEVGHAIPALIFTKGEVSIYLGSYGDTKHTAELALNKRLTICFKVNILKWNKGMVRHMPVENSFYKELIILIMGPMMSLLIAVVAIWIAFGADLNGFLKLFSTIFFFSALFDLRSLYPAQNPLLTDDGSLIYYDGYQIARLFKYRKANKNLSLAYDFYNEGNYAKALALFENLSPPFVNTVTLNLAIHSYIKLKQYAKAKEFYSKTMIKLEFKPDLDTLCNLGLIESYLNDNDTAMLYYNQSIELNEHNVYAICNRAYTFNLYEEYDKALVDFDKVIAMDSQSAYAYANRAYSKIKLRLFDDALNDINTAFNLNDKEPYAYKNWGLYYLEKGEYNKALQQFQVASDLDPHVHMIDHYIKITKEKLTELT